MGDRLADLHVEMFVEKDPVSAGREVARAKKPRMSSASAVRARRRPMKR